MTAPHSSIGGAQALPVRAGRFPVSADPAGVSSRTRPGEGSTLCPAPFARRSSACSKEGVMRIRTSFGIAVLSVAVLGVAGSSLRRWV